MAGDTNGGRLAAAIEIGSDGWCIVHFPAVPGAGFKARGVAEAVAEAPGRLAGEVEWLAARGQAPLDLQPPWAWTPPSSRQDHGEVAQPGGGQPETVFLETVRTGAITAAGDSEGYFTWCGQALTPALVEQALGHLAAGRRHLLEMVAQRGADWLDARPAPGKRSPREALHHLADAELFYLVRLNLSQAEARENWKAWSGRGQPEMERLSAIRERLAAALTSLSDACRARVSAHDPHSELWTPLKVAYRAIWHERYTTRLL